MEYPDETLITPIYVKTDPDMPVRDGHVVARRYEGTPKDCSGCHEDVHREQFADYAGCTSCHASQLSWDLLSFDHNSQSEFPLTGAHRLLDCSACHKPVGGLSEGGSYVRYKPMGKECRDCHDIDPRSTRTDR